MQNNLEVSLKYLASTARAVGRRQPSCAACPPNARRWPLAFSYTTCPACSATMVTTIARRATAHMADRPRSCVHGIKQWNSGRYNLPWMMLDRVKTSALRTTNVSEADIFFVPVWARSKRDCTTRSFAYLHDGRRQRASQLPSGSHGPTWRRTTQRGTWRSTAASSNTCCPMIAMMHRPV